MVSRKSIIIVVLTFFFQFMYAQLRGQTTKYYGKKEVLPKIPPRGERMKVLIVSDADNEIDDIWAISLAILSPERFDIVGFVGSNFDHPFDGIGPRSIDSSVKVIRTILQKAGMEGKYPVYPGADPMQYEFAPGKSAGVDFIVKEAMKATAEKPLWIICLGDPTDLASAYLQQPAIKDRVVMFWHARTEATWPYRAHNYNIQGDILASRMMFMAPFSLVLFDTGSQLFAGTLEESAKYVKPYGALGEYLYNYRLRNSYFSSPNKGYFDMGDIAALINPDLGTWEITRCPTVTPYMDYNFYTDNGVMLRCNDIDRDKTFALFYNKLKNFKARVAK